MNLSRYKDLGYTNGSGDVFEEFVFGNRLSWKVMTSDGLMITSCDEYVSSILLRLSDIQEIRSLWMMLSPNSTETTIPSSEFRLLFNAASLLLRVTLPWVKEKRRLEICKQGYPKLRDCTYSSSSSSSVAWAAMCCSIRPATCFTISDASSTAKYKRQALNAYRLMPLAVTCPGLSVLYTSLGVIRCLW